MNDNPSDDIDQIDQADQSDRKAFGLAHYQYGRPQGRQG